MPGKKSLFEPTSKIQKLPKRTPQNQNAPPSHRDRKESLDCIKDRVIRQEESRSICENVTWGQRKRFADGKVSLAYSQFLGYEKGEDDAPKIVEKEAKVVRLIYKLFLEGKTPNGIAKLYMEYTVC